MVLRFLQLWLSLFYFLPAHRVYLGFSWENVGQICGIQGAKVIVIKHGDMLISPQFDRTPWFSWFSSTATALAFIQFTKADMISAAELVDDG